MGESGRYLQLTSFYITSDSKEKKSSIDGARPIGHCVHPSCETGSGSDSCRYVSNSGSLRVTQYDAFQVADLEMPTKKYHVWKKPEKKKRKPPQRVGIGPPPPPYPGVMPPAYGWSNKRTYEQAFGGAGRGRPKSYPGMMSTLPTRVGMALHRLKMAGKGHCSCKHKGAGTRRHKGQGRRLY